MGVRGALAPSPLSGQNSMLFVFLERKYYVFRHFYRNIMFLSPPPAPWKIFPLPGKKSSDAHVLKPFVMKGMYWTCTIFLGYLANFFWKLGSSFDKYVFKQGFSIVVENYI